MTTVADKTALRSLAGETEERLLNSFFVLYKNARIVEQHNPVFKRQCANFLKQLEALFESSNEVAIKTIAGRYFVNQSLVRFDDQGVMGAGAIVKEWETLGLAGVTFSDNVSLEEIEYFFTFMTGVRPRDRNTDSLSEILKSHKQPGIQLLSAQEIESEFPRITEEIRRQFRAAARATFFRAMAVVEEVTTNTTEGKETNVSKTKRVIQALIDHIMKDEQSLLELATIKNFDDYTYAHSTNVCVYSLTFGVRLGLDRARLSQLGFSALFHDIGKVKLPADLIRKPDSYDENDWIQMQLHPLLGTKTILRNLKLNTHTARAARAAFEHHINADFTGYPTLQRQKRPVNLFSKIVSIADTFDALTSGRVYLKKAIPPDQVLKKMYYQMKVKFDPLLLKIFNDIIGVYPAGMLVLLSTDEIALVLTNNETDKARPYVKIVGTRQGLLETPDWVDLSLPEHSHRRIVRMIEPDRYGLDIRDFVLTD